MRACQSLSSTQMMTYAVSYVATLAMFLAADMVWLGTMVNRIYRPALGDVLLASVNFPPALVFYLIYPIGFVIFAVLPGIRERLSGDRGDIWRLLSDSSRTLLMT